MNTPRRAAHRLFFHVGHVDLCPDCMAVLAKEGEVAGDPREPAVTFTGHRRTEPAPLGVACDTCASLEAYEDALGHALTTAVHEDLTAGRLTCDDADFGTPEEHARWHANHDTPTLAELEGEDAPPQEQGSWDSYHTDSDVLEDHPEGHSPMTPLYARLVSF